jgi:hypothetical protein
MLGIACRGGPENADKQIRAVTEIKAGRYGTMQRSNHRRPQRIPRQAGPEGCTPSATDWFDEAMENRSRIVAYVHRTVPVTENSTQGA